MDIRFPEPKKITKGQRMVASSRKTLFLDSGNDSSSIERELRAKGWDIDFSLNIADASEQLASNQYEVGIARVNRVDQEYLSAVARLIRESRKTEWIALTPQMALNRSGVVRMIRENFYDFHTLPIDYDRLATTLGRAQGMSALTQVGPSIDVESGAFGMIGASDAMRRVYKMISRISRVAAPALIIGESGTGKELTARAMHAESDRADGPFIAVNCAALPSELIESQLFGHKKGAFTGAHRDHAGLIEAAKSGTLFLDEVGDMPLSQQGHLLRFLEEKEFVPVGATKPVFADTRVLFATNANLETLVEEGRMRMDLYFRINSIQLKLPPLRDRNGDVELLAKHFFDKFSAQKSRRLRGIGVTAMRAMADYSWPGNVRELVNLVQHAVVLSDSRFLQPEDLRLQSKQSERRAITLQRARADAEFNAINDALRYSANNVSEAARHLGVTRVTLHRLIKKYDVQKL